MSNAITDFLTSTQTEAANMRTDDFMFYFADIFVESVQYGNRTSLCDMLASKAGETQEQIFQAVTDFGTNVADVNPPDYDTSILANTQIDIYASGRPWTYQYCTEYGFF